MDQIQLLAESTIKIEIKQEPEDYAEDADWGFTEELRPPIALFDESFENQERAWIDEEKDPRALGCESSCIVTIKQETGLWFPDGRSFPAGNDSPVQAQQKSEDLGLVSICNSRPSCNHQAMDYKHKHARAEAIQYQCSGNRSTNYSPEPLKEAQKNKVHEDSILRRRFTLKRSIAVAQKCQVPKKPHQQINFKCNKASERYLPSHTDEMPYQYTIPHKNFVDKCSIQMQSLDHQIKIDCSKSKRSVACRNYFYMYKRTRSSVKPYECVRCKVRFSFGSSLILHLNKQKCRKIYINSSKLFMPKRMFDKYIVGWKGIHSNFKPNDKRKKNLNSCKLTPTVMKTRVSTFHKKSYPTHFMNEHVSTTTWEKPFQCSIYEKSFSKKQSLSVHIPTHSCEKHFRCSICEKRFSKRGSLCRHMRIHTGEKPFQCSICEKRFSRKSDLCSHMRTHTGEKPFQCSICEKRFSHKGELNAHMRSHTGEKGSQCSICGKCFSQKLYLCVHMRIHTGEKPFQCSVCEKQFSRRFSLCRHMCIHAGEKPFQCSICEKKFSQKGELNAHMRSHTDEKRFQCSICGKCFSQKLYLCEHMRTHTGEKPFQCSVCEKRFSRRFSLCRHMRIHTGE